MLQYIWDRMLQYIWSPRALSDDNSNTSNLPCHCTPHKVTSPKETQGRSSTCSIMCAASTRFCDLRRRADSEVSALSYKHAHKSQNMHIRIFLYLDIWILVKIQCVVASPQWNSVWCFPAVFFLEENMFLVFCNLKQCLFNST